MKSDYRFKALGDWLKFGGGVNLRSTGEETIRVSIEDPGGTTSEWITTVDDLQSALNWAEEKTEAIIKANREMVELQHSGKIPWPDDEYICVPGLRPFRNPSKE